MKGLLGKILVLASIAAVIYVPLFTIRIVRENEIGVVEDAGEKRVVAVFSKETALVRAFSRDINIVWQGSLFWLYRVYAVSRERSVTLKVVVPVPPMETLNKDHYSVRIPVRCVYRLKGYDIFNRDLLGDYGGKLDEFMAGMIQGEFSKEMNSYFRPVYRGDMIENRIEDIVAAVWKRVKDDSEGLGIGMQSMKISGGTRVPDAALYAEGVKFVAEARAFEHKSKMELLGVKNAIERGKLTDEEYYKKLTRLSRIFKQNPDVLRYIYIDKISGGAKVITSREMEGLSKDFEKGLILPAGEIDNLR